MRPQFENFLREESGATSIEYAVIAAGVSVAILSVANTLGAQMQTTFTSVSKSLAAADK